MNCIKTKVLVLFLCLYGSLIAQEKTKNQERNENEVESVISGLEFRSIGPAYTSGRIADFAVNPDNHSEYFVAVASGNVWKTTNNGTTWTPVFEKYGSYSTGCITLDPNNTNVVWLGTGENNHQRALGYGDGIYKSVDGGKSWENAGLKESRQIGGIIVDPRDSDVVYVACEGSAWGSGGDRGLYKTTDGGSTWEPVLTISENTGVNSIVMDPRNPDVIYASSEQRRRHVHTKIGGGPETAIYKTTDAGENWKKLSSGLPSAHMGGIGLAVSPANPDVVYAIIEAAGDAGGFFRSTDRGMSWEKMSDHHSSGQYYNEIFCDPVNEDKVYSMETVSKYTLDGGKTWKNLGLDNRHVDDHALWIDPDNTDHILIGGDGGIYETFDMGKNWDFKTNLPITQFYRVAVDNSEPFYYVYGGTQDNNSMGGPSQNTKSKGVTSGEWFVTNGGDGFWGAIDPTDPNIVYAEAQYGNMVRYDRKSGEAIYIRPEPRENELSYRWNWNTPLIISPHNHKRLYTAANKVFRTDDRGNNWKVISGDITAQIDRNKWPVMGKYWSADAVAKDVSTSLYGTIVSLAESPVVEDLLYAGTDDGLIRITEDAGGNWIKQGDFPGVPENTYVSDIMPSKFDENTVFASFDNRKRDDFAPYILKSTDKGESWEMITNGLPQNGTVHTLEQDNINKDLLFAGTEFGVFFTTDGGANWVQLKAGIPVIAVRDMVIQERENDLVVATFGRGMYVLDDYAPLRSLDKKLIESEAYLFPVKDARMYIQSRNKYGQGATYFIAENPNYGAVFTYYLKEEPASVKKERKMKEVKLFEAGEAIPQPTLEELRQEELEDTPFLLFTIKDAEGNVVRKITSTPKKGINRVNWDLRYPSSNPVTIKNGKFNATDTDKSGILAMPGDYSVTMAIVENDRANILAEPQSFKVTQLNNRTLPAESRQEYNEFHVKVAELSRAARGTFAYVNELEKQANEMKQALLIASEAPLGLMYEADTIVEKLQEIQHKLHGYEPKASDEELPPHELSIEERLGSLVWAQYRSTSNVTGTQKMVYQIAVSKLDKVMQEINAVVNNELEPLEDKLEDYQVPYTSGRVPKIKL